MQAENASPQVAGPSLKSIALGALVLVLAAMAAYAVVREMRLAKQPDAQVAAPMGEQPQRPAMSAEDERYARDLWQIHEPVRTAAVRMSFTGISYKLGEIDKTEFRKRVSALTETYRDAGTKIRGIQPPASLASLHAEYVDALQAYLDASIEMAKAAKTGGGDENLIKAQAMSERASTTLLKVGETLWPGEYKPN
jgi:hypothetical protein